ncbi:MAG: PAS domain-containing sensor histidine kinase [Bryobacteraceae bacterium]
MSLKTRLRVSIVALVVSVVLALSALNLYSVASAKFGDLTERATATAQQVQTMLVQSLARQTSDVPPPASLAETKALWAGIIESDQQFAGLLQDTLASSRTILEIQVVGETGRILASSDPSGAGTIAKPLPSLANWSGRGQWRQLVDLFRGRQDYAVVMPLGVAEQAEPVFRIRVIYSSVLLRNTLTPLVQQLGVALSISFLAAIALAVLVSNIAFRPLARVSDAIDRIAKGESPLPTGPGKEEPKEVAALESKLQVLGQQFRGARQDAVELRGNIEQLLERLEEAVLLFDRDNRLIMAGRAVEGLLGRGRWELMGRSLQDLFPPSTALGAAVSGAVGFRRPLKDSLVALERDGHPATRLLVNVELLESFPGRDRLGTLVSLRDAESRREIGTRLDLSTRLAAISRLTGGAAHEIKNPLNSIALHVEVLRAQIGDQVPEASREIDVISSEITRLDRVVKTFLDFTRPVDLQLAPVDAVELVRELATLVTPEAAKQGVHLALDCDSGPVTLEADRDMLKQAVLNVVMNAVESMKTGGRLGMSVKRVGPDCVIQVSDQGAGIPAAVREKIFNLYFTTKQHGSGIGLAMTFRVVQLHNGSIDFASEPGKGTTFWLRLPARQLATPVGAGEA